MKSKANDRIKNYQIIGKGKKVDDDDDELENGLFLFDVDESQSF
jgi:hypothetical protein